MTQLSNYSEPLMRQYRTITQDLEAEARDLVRNMKIRQYSGLSITSLLKQDITLTLEQIDRLRDLQERQLRSLCRTECYVDTELMQMEERTPRYSPYRFPERDKLQKRLFAIEAERRKRAVMYEDRLQGLQNKLLSLMQKHKQLDVRSNSKNLEAYVQR